MRIWFDTEFIDTGSIVQMLSIGMVREDGQTYYAESSDSDHTMACEWVRDNVIVHLRCGDASKPCEQIRDEIVAFCGDKPEFWAYFASYDWLVLCQLFGRMLDVPSHWPNFVHDVQSFRMILKIGELPKQMTTEHNALNDALWTRQAYEHVFRR